MAATQGHTQSLHTNALDEALALPTDFSARIARNTQLFLQLESGTTRIIDPWGGSFYVERLTDELAAPALDHIAEIDALGGMAKAIEAGVPQARNRGGGGADAGADRLRPADGGRRQPLPPDRRAAARGAPRRQLRRARGADREAEAPARRARRRRDAGGARGAHRRGAKSGAQSPRRLPSRRRGRRRPSAKSARRWRTSSAATSTEATAVSRHLRARKWARTPARRSPSARALVDRFARSDGRPPRILVAKVGQDGHDRGQKVIASAFADLGFDVDIGPLFQTPEEAARHSPSTRTSISSASPRSPPAT